VIPDEFPASTVALGHICSRDVFCVPRNGQIVKETKVVHGGIPCRDRAYRYNET
jgi:hypothetical protein